MNSPERRQASLELLVYQVGQANELLRQLDGTVEEIALWKAGVEASLEARYREHRDQQAEGRDWAKGVLATLAVIGPIIGVILGRGGV